MLPKFYQTHLQKCLTTVQVVILGILINVLQSERKVQLERLARVFPCPILSESRRRKIQRFLSIPQLSLTQIWYPIVVYWLETYCQKGQKLSIVIDRSQWGAINLMMVSLVWNRRAIPLSWSLLPKLGSSNLQEQQETITEIIPLLKDYQVVVLGDREFCSVELAHWLQEKGLSFCLRLKGSTCIETEPGTWKALNNLGLTPGMSLYFSGVKVRKTQPITGFNVASRWKRKYRHQQMKQGWFLLTNLGSSSAAIAAYQQRMGIEEMFRDYKSGGYHLEGTGLTGHRLMSLILLVALAYTSAIIQGTTVQEKALQWYVACPQSPHRKYPRRSTFGIGLDTQQWFNNLEQYAPQVQQLISLTPHKRRFYQRGMNAVNQFLPLF